jgi:hypothetical protein
MDSDTVSELKITVNDAKDIPAKLAQIFDLVSRGIKRGPVVVTLGRLVRSLRQNKRMWAVLGDIEKQVDWHGLKLDKEDWKEMFSAILGNQRVVPGLQGGFVVLGVSTRKQNKAWFSDLFELINAFGAEHGVMWSDPALEAFDYYREAQK